MFFSLAAYLVLLRVGVFCYCCRQEFFVRSNSPVRLFFLFAVAVFLVVGAGVVQL